MEVMQFDPPATILAVDDIPQNLQVLNAYLSPEGFNLAVAQSGVQALKVLEKIQPDVILLDVMMPELDGYQTCEKIQANPAWRHIPVIFLTARVDEEDLLQGFESGGVDYVTKPFQPAELLARIRTHVELKRNRDLMKNFSATLQEKNHVLEILNQEKDQFLGIASHDLKNPLSAISGMAEIMLAQPELKPPEIVHYSSLIHGACQRMMRIITNLLDISRLETGHIHVQAQNLHLPKLLQELKAEFEPKAQAKQLALELQLESTQELLYTDENLLRQILQQLLSNALKFSPANKTIALRVLDAGEGFCLQVQDQGPGLTEQDQSKLFQKYARLSAKPTGGETSIGLGLVIAKRLSELLQGQLSCRSSLGQGSCFELEIKPYHKPAR